MSAKALEEWQRIRPLSEECWQWARRVAPRSQRVEKFMECMQRVLRELYPQSGP